ncbi:MAG: helix-turn-helix domain-containing protein [Clostridia bacterium]|nr:helix-turn-helix domain-containing protein [Clostridia bacterium]
MFVQQAMCFKDIWSDSVKLVRAFKVEADSSYTVHHQPLKFDENILIVVTEGNGHFEFDGFSDNLTAGDIVVLNTDGKPFNYNTIGDVWNFWWFEFSGNAERIQKNISLLQNRHLLDLCSKCLDFATIGDQKAASSVLGALLSLIKFALSEPTTENEHTVFSNAVGIINANLKTINVSTLSKKLHISERTLHDVFVLNTSCSPKQYILNLKFNTACFLLKNTNKTIGEISEHLGFSSPFHFSRFFSSKTNASPLKWRKKDRFD